MSDLYKVTVYDSYQYLKLQNIVNVIKTLEYETDNILTSSIHYQLYSRGNSIGFSFTNSTGRTVNLICVYIGYKLKGFFGNHQSVNSDEISGEFKEVDFNENYTLAAESIMEYLVNNKLPD